MNALLTWRLWRRLREPPDETPMYRRVLGQPGPAMPWYIGCAELIGFILIVPMLLLMGPIYGLAWTVGISGNITATKRTGVYDLAALAPGGPLAVSWACARATLDRNGGFANSNARNTWLGRVMIVLILYFAAIHAPRLASGERLDLPLVALAALLALIVIDQTQSMLIAVLVGMVAPTLTDERGSVQTIAFALYAGIALGTYLATAALTALLYATFRLLGLDALPALTLALAGGLAFFAGLREWVIRQLWRMLLDRLNADAAALDRIG